MSKRKITCRYPFQCRMYDICKCKIKDKEPEKCKVRFDYEFQARKLIMGMEFEEIEGKQQGFEK